MPVFSSLSGIVRHVFGGALDDVGPFFERRAGRTQAIFQFGKENRMRLFPQEHLIAYPWCGAALGAHRLRHFRPL